MNVKIVFFWLLLWGVDGTLYADSCSVTKENAQNAIVFLDLNHNPREIETARRAACTRGEYLIVLPENSPAQYENSQLKDKLRWARERDIKINSMILSGHNGGGRFSGENGGISRYEMSQILDGEGVSSGFPEVKNSVRSIVLLGCYTAVKNEINAWTDLFPNANFVAGYEGSAPLGKYDSGNNYLRDVLLREEDLNKAKNEAQIKRIFDSKNSVGIQSLAGLNAALYFKPRCEAGIDPDLSFYYDKRKGFHRYSEAECESLRAEGGEGLRMASLFREYDVGNKDIPENTRRSELRDIYNFFNTNYHCFEAEVLNRTFRFPDRDRIMFTLFFNDMKKNFARHYEENGTLPQLREHLDELKRQLNRDTARHIEGLESYNNYLKNRKTLEPLSAEINSVNREIRDLFHPLVAKYEVSQNQIVDREYMAGILSREDKVQYAHFMNALKYANNLKKTFERQNYNVTDNDGIPHFVSNFVKNSINANERVITNPDLYRAQQRKKLEDVEIPSMDFYSKSSRATLFRHSHKIKTLMEDPYFKDKDPNNIFGNYRHQMFHKLYQNNCIPDMWHEYNPNRRLEPLFCD